MANAENARSGFLPTSCINHRAVVNAEIARLHGCRTTQGAVVEEQISARAVVDSGNPCRNDRIVYKGMGYIRSCSADSIVNEAIAAVRLYLRRFQFTAGDIIILINPRIFKKI